MNLIGIAGKGYKINSFFIYFGMNRITQKILKITATNTVAISATSPSRLSFLLLLYIGPEETRLGRNWEEIILLSQPNLSIHLITAFWEPGCYPIDNSKSSSPN